MTPEQIRALAAMWEQLRRMRAAEAARLRRWAEVDRINAEKNPFTACEGHNDRKITVTNATIETTHDHRWLWAPTVGKWSCACGEIKDGPAPESAPAPEPIMQFFGYAHLPPAMQEVSRPFCELAKQVSETLPRNAERSVALRKLLEAKDAAVRAAIAK